MSLTNTLKKQIDMPVWEWCRLAPSVSSAVSATTSADNSLYHVSFGRYIYYFQGNPSALTAGTGAGGTGIAGFFRYDTVSDTYQLLAQPPVAVSIMTTMQFAGDQGYSNRVLSGGPNTLTAAALTGRVLNTFDIKIVSGTGIGQMRVISDVSDPLIVDAGTVTTAVAPPPPQSYFTDSTKNWTINQWVGYQVRFVSPAGGQSQVRKIIYNNSTSIYFSDNAKLAEEPLAWVPVIANGGYGVIVSAASLYQIEASTISVDTNWAIPPDATSKFVVRSGGIWMVSAGTNYTMQYYDVAADLWYVRNAASATSPESSAPAAGCDVTIVNSGETATTWYRGVSTASSTQYSIVDASSTLNWVPTVVSPAVAGQWYGYCVRIYPVQARVRCA